jgi:hypothetical protein
MNEVYRLSWEMVLASELWRYSNADPLTHKNTTQTVPNSRIPDEHWHLVQKTDTDPWAQYNTLRKWAKEDRDFVRNVRLEKQVSEPEWEDVQ